MPFGPRARILRVVSKAYGGPRPRLVLEALAKRYGAGPELLEEMIARRELVKFSDKRHARYGLPRRKKP